MLSIGMLGIGKLGLPVAVSIARRYEVHGYDKNPALNKKRKYEHRELGPDGEDNFQGWLDNSTLKFADSVEDLVAKTDLIFVAVQTPHQKQFDGSKRVPHYSRADFDYSHLVEACRELSLYVTEHHTVAIISTVLPGTMRREILPIFEGKCGVVYNPFFIAMGEVMKDFEDPEFVLVGADKSGAYRDLWSFYYEFYKGLKDVLWLNVESAELTKVGYNLLISTKITFINTLMEVAHRTPGCDIDEVSSTLKLATNRLISPKYLSGGLGDGGHCHPRDMLAMSYLSRNLSLKTDTFDHLIYERERQSEWMVNEFLKEAGDLPKVILGKSFKAESGITAGSAALLIGEMMKEKGEKFLQWDPLVDGEEVPKGMLDGAHAYFVATKHKCFKAVEFPKGSVIVDPHRYIPEEEGIKVIKIGVGR